MFYTAVTPPHAFDNEGDGMYVCVLSTVAMYCHIRTFYIACI